MSVADAHLKTRHQLVVGYRVEVAFQIGFPPFVTNTLSAGPLGSTGITPFLSYYGPLRFPTRPTYGYVFPYVVEDITLSKPGLSGY